jgi:NADH-quinone oxidoreductase subunit J
LLVGLLLVAIPTDAFKSTAFNPQRISVDGSQLLRKPVENSAISYSRNISNTEALGLVLYTDYFLAFELAAVLLLVAIVSAITLVHRGVVRSKRQNITQQIMTQSTDRVTLISMKSEK